MIGMRLTFLQVESGVISIESAMGHSRTSMWDGFSLARIKRLMVGLDLYARIMRTEPLSNSVLKKLLVVGIL